MTKGGTGPTDPRDSLNLKLPEPDVLVAQPWNDDLLNRVRVAEKLTNLIRHQTSPFVISLHGNWGTGKTFLLKRWQRDLENQGYKAIYFNAWEDDFCDDPLLAILGQLSEYFKEGLLKALASDIAKVALPLIRQNILGVLEKHTGVTLALEPNGETQQDPFDIYHSQRATKDNLKKRLTEMAAKVSDETEQPVVFIIDELDRCRPTFAIELLERVKHLFDIPNLVFVFGMNRDELCLSLQSVYGDIDADVYLRRFFDMEFTLPEADSETFCRQLMDKFGLAAFFVALSTNTTTHGNAEDFQNLDRFFPSLCSRLGLSLRDIDHCVRLIALVGRNIKERQHAYPWLLSMLIALKLKNLALYRQFIQGNCPGSEVMNYISKMIPLPIDHRLDDELTVMEAHLCLLDRHMGESRVSRAVEQLRLLENGEPLTQPHLLSERTKESGPVRAKNLLRITEGRLYIPSDVIGYLAELIDLHQDFIRR